MNYQGVGMRFVATIIDTVLLMIPFCVIGFIIAGATDEATGSGFELEGASALLFFAVGFALWLGYYTLLEGMFGATLGKLALGLRVVHNDGGKIDLQTALVRNLLRLVDGIFVYLVAAVLIWTSPTKQRLGDRVARTIVVRKADAAATDALNTPSNVEG